jgi:TDG/mug DNA glycosylase family protein
MTVLPDYLEPGLRVVFCGTAPGLISAARGHYYAGPGNAFWTLLYQAGFVDHEVGPEHDSTMPHEGIGLTDLVKTMAQSHDRGLPYDVAGLDARVRAAAPAWLAFTSKEAGGAAARWLGERPPALGRQDWGIGGAQVWVLPSPSGRNQGRASYDGRATRLEWWAELARVVGAVR